MDFFSQITKQLQDNQKRWEKIDVLIRRVKEFDEPEMDDVVGLLLLLVEQLRPTQNSIEQVENIQKEVSDLLKNLKPTK